MPAVDSLPVVAAAIHDGHALRPQLERYMQLTEAERLREEDPHTGSWTAFTPWRIVGDRSRFEVDLNRPPEKAVYRVPADCWGLEVWDPPLPQAEIEESLRVYKSFYRDAKKLLKELIATHGRIVVYDLHSYNHRRAGAEAPPACAEDFPDINIGTGSVNHDLWRPVVDRLIAELRSARIDGKPLDVRENVCFRGGHFSQWIHKTFPETAVCLAIEVKKIFMDEWTGVPDPHMVAEIGRVLGESVPGVVGELSRIPQTAK